MAIGRPAAIARREPLIVWRMRWYPSCICVFRLEYDQRRNRFAAGADTLNTSYPLLPASNYLSA